MGCGGGLSQNVGTRGGLQGQSRGGDSTAAAGGGGWGVQRPCAQSHSPNLPHPTVGQPHNPRAPPRPQIPPQPHPLPQQQPPPNPSSPSNSPQLPAISTANPPDRPSSLRTGSPPAPTPPGTASGPRYLTAPPPRPNAPHSRAVPRLLPVLAAPARRPPPPAYSALLLAAVRRNELPLAAAAISQPAHAPRGAPPNGVRRKRAARRKVPGSARSSAVRAAVLTEPNSAQHKAERDSHCDKRDSKECPNSLFFTSYINHVLIYGTFTDLLFLDINRQRYLLIRTTRSPIWAFPISPPTPPLPASCFCAQK